jgi:hypothetical protein
MELVALVEPLSFRKPKPGPDVGLLSGVLACGSCCQTLSHRTNILVLPLLLNEVLALVKAIAAEALTSSLLLCRAAVRGAGPGRPAGPGPRAPFHRLLVLVLFVDRPGPC